MADDKQQSEGCPFAHYHRYLMVIPTTEPLGLRRSRREKKKTQRSSKLEQIK